MSPKRALIASAFMVTALGMSAHVSAQVMGAMGDSLTDEYAESDYDYALNWVQQLVIFRGLDFGLTADEAGQPDGTWGEPRRTQYEQNWARAGADSSSLLALDRHTGLAAQIIPLEIDYAFLGIGANDFAPVPIPGFAYFNIYWDLWSESQVENYINTIVDRIATAIDTVLEAGNVNFILATVPDYGITPVAVDFFPNPENRQKVTAVIESLNEELEELAAEREIVLVDIFGLSAAIFGPHEDFHETLLLGNVPIFLGESDTPMNTDPQAAFVHDELHPHTTLQGMFANVIVTAMNIGYGAGVPPFTEAEILDHAGIAYGGSDTLETIVGEWADYVLDFTPSTPGDLNGDGVVDVFDLLILISEWGACDDCDDCIADITNDCTVGLDDLLILLSNWG